MPGETHLYNKQIKSRKAKKDERSPQGPKQTGLLRCLPRRYRRGAGDADAHGSARPQSADREQYPSGNVID
jgi:hypothetical protein